MTVPVETFEWSELTPENTPALTGFYLPEDSVTASIVNDIRDRVDIQEGRYGLSITTKSHVGRIEIGDLQLTIRPKIRMKSLLSLVRYTYGLRDLLLKTTTQQSLSKSSFQDLLILQLLIETKELIARGLKKDYQRQSDALPVLKGRIDIQSIIRQGGIVDSTIPNIYYSRTLDTVFNQLLLAGLYFVSRITSDVELVTEARRFAMRIADDITQYELTPNLLQSASLQMNRLHRAYQPILNILSLLLEGAGITLKSESSMMFSGFLFDMNRFWEDLLLRFLQENLPEYDVRDQYHLNDMMRYVNLPNTRQKRAPSPRPDYVILKEGEIYSILDAKYRDIWSKGLPSDMLYQLAIYALSQGFQGQSKILYPVVDATATREVIEIQDPINSSSQAYIRLQPINLYDLEELISDNSYYEQKQRYKYISAKILN